MEYNFENGDEYLREWEMNPGEVEGPHNRMIGNPRISGMKPRAWGPLALARSRNEARGGLVSAVSHQWIEISHNRKESERGSKLKIGMKQE